MFHAMYLLIRGLNCVFNRVNALHTESLKGMPIFSFNLQGLGTLFSLILPKFC